MSRMFRTSILHKPKTFNKVSIIGIGDITEVCGAALCSTGYSGELCIINPINPLKAMFEAQELKYCGQYFHGVTVTGGGDLELTRCSNIVIVCFDHNEIQATLGVDTVPLVQINVDLFSEIIPKLVKFSPKVILFIATFPYNVMTYVAWNYAKIPRNRVLGLGSCMETAKFRLLLAGHFDVSPRVLHASIIGAINKFYRFPVWTDVTLAGTRLVDALPNPESFVDGDTWFHIPRMLHFKGETVFIGNCWATSAACVSIAQAIINNTHEVFPVSTNAIYLHGNMSPAFMGLPCVICRNGIYANVAQQLNVTDTAYIKKAAKLCKTLYGYIKFDDENSKLATAQTLVKLSTCSDSSQFQNVNNLLGTSLSFVDNN